VVEAFIGEIVFLFRLRSVTIPLYRTKQAKPRDTPRFLAALHRKNGFIPPFLPVEKYYFKT